MTPAELAVQMFECIAKGDDEGFEALGAQPEACAAVSGKDGRELLAHAVLRGQPKSVHALLELGVHPDLLVRHWRGCQPAMTTLFALATELGRGRIAVDLVRHGVRPDHQYPPQSVELNQDVQERRQEFPTWTLAQDVMNMPDVALREILPLIGTVGSTGHCPLLSAALQAKRIDLARELLTFSLPLRWWRGDRHPSPLILAAQQGLSDLIQPILHTGLAVNATDQDRRTALHHAIRSPTADPAARARTARALLEGWAVPELRDVDSQNAYEAAKATGCDLLQKVLAEHGLAHGPRQSREARARNVRDVCLTYDKADGFIYRIGIPDQPFLEGGDYDGCYSCDVNSAGEVFARVEQGWPRIHWFKPFLERLQAGREFSFDQLVQASASARFYGFEEPANWHY